MAIPLVIWMAAGVGASGVTMYKNADSTEKIIESSLGRYKDTKYAFYKTEAGIIPLVEKIAISKLTAWKGYGRMFDILKKIANRPAKYYFRGYGEMRLMAKDIAKLYDVGFLVRKMDRKGILKVGTGVFSVIALQGGASTVRGQELMIENANDNSVLERVVATEFDSENIGLMEELAVFNAIVCAPQLSDDSKITKVDVASMHKDDAFKLKERLDSISLAMADATERLAKLQEVMELVHVKLEKLHELHWRQMDFLEELIKTKTDYMNFTTEEKSQMNYAITLGFALRELARLDLVVSNGSIAVINRLAIRECMEKSRDLLSVEHAVQ